MERTISAQLEVNGRRHGVEARVDVLTDRATIRVDRAEVRSTLVRRPFSSLFRFRFEVDGVPFELRMTPKGLHDVELSIVRADAPAGGSGLSLPVVAAGAGLPGVVAALALSGVMEPLWAIGIGAFASLGTFAILWLVYGRRA